MYQFVDITKKTALYATLNNIVKLCKKHIYLLTPTYMVMATVTTTDGTEFCPTTVYLEKNLKERAKFFKINLSKTFREAVLKKLDEVS